MYQNSVSYMPPVMNPLVSSVRPTYSSSAIETVVASTPAYSAVSVGGGNDVSYGSSVASSSISVSGFGVENGISPIRYSGGSGGSIYAGGVESGYVTLSPSVIPEMNFEPSNFIKVGFSSVFVGDASAIKADVKEAFLRLVGSDLPSNIIISIVSSLELRKRGLGKGVQGNGAFPAHGNSISNVMGVSYNRSIFGMSEVMVVSGSLASVMLTMGHELGHVFTPTLGEAWLEEAKAYAVSFAWMEIVRRFDIAGLGSAFVEYMPAMNGVHDKGYAYVMKKVRSGMSYWEVYLEIVGRES